MSRHLRLISIGMFLNVTAFYFLWPLNAIYIHQYLHQSLSFAGFILMMNSAASMVGNFVGGVLFDRIGGFRSILIGIMTTTFAMVVLIFFHSLIFYACLLTIIGFGGGIVFPGLYSMAGSLQTSDRRKAYNTVYVAGNLGTAIGSALGGMVAAFSFRFVFMLNGFFYLIFLGFAYIALRSIETKIEKPVDIPKPVQNRIYTANTRSIALFCLIYLICWVAYSQWNSTISSYTHDLGISLYQFSLLWTINGAFIVLGQPIITFMIKYLTKSLLQQIVMGIFIFLTSFLLLLHVHHFGGFILGMIILSIGEMLLWPTFPTLISSLAPANKLGFYQGIINGTAGAGRMLGPFIGGLIVDYAGMDMLVHVIIVVLSVSLISSFVYSKVARSKRSRLAIQEYPLKTRA